MPDGLVIDTCVLVDFLREESASQTYLAGLLGRGVSFVHPVSVAELIVGTKSRRELADTTRFLGLSKQLRVKDVDFRACLAIVSRFHHSDGIGWEDCLIAATCLRLEMPIVTVNDKHFRPIPGLRVVRPY